MREEPQRHDPPDEQRKPDELYEDAVGDGSIARDAPADEKPFVRESNASNYGGSALPSQDADP